jgi:hypothetical protein
LGERLDAEDVLIMNSKIPLIILLNIRLFSGYLITKQLGYSIPLYFMIQLIPLVALGFIKNESVTQFTKVLVTLLSLIFLKDNQHCIPLFLLIIIGSCIIKYKDQNSCIVGTQRDEAIKAF